MRYLLVALLLAMPLAAQPTRELSLSVTAETVPAGSNTQIRVWLKSPRSITEGSFSLVLDSSVFGRPAGIDVFSAAGDQTGSIRYEGNRLTVSFASSAGGIGLLPGMPVAAITVPVLTSARAATIRVEPSEKPWRDVEGNYWQQAPAAVEFRPGGSVVIDAVTPGGGPLPDGITLRITGNGFTPDTAVTIEDVPLAGTRFVDRATLEATLAGPADPTGRKMTVRTGPATVTDFYLALRTPLFDNGTGFVFPSRLFTDASDYPAAALNPHQVPVTIRARYPPLRNMRPDTVDLIRLGPGEAFRNMRQGPPSAASYLAPDKPVRFAATGPLYGSVLSAPGVWWTSRPPACDRTNTYQEGTCWFVLEGAGPSSATLTLDAPRGVPSSSADWLSVTAEPAKSTTSTHVILTANPASLPPGDHDVSIALTFPDGDYLAPVSIPVTLRVAETQVRFANPPPYLYFTGRSSDPVPPPIRLDVTANRDGTPFRIELQSKLDSSWYLVSPREGVTPATLEITFDPSRATQFYSGAGLVLRGPSNSVSIVSALYLTDLVRPFPPKIGFWATPNGPGPQPVMLPESDYLEQGCRRDDSRAVTSDASWLHLTAPPFDVRIEADPSGLAPGVYRASVQIPLTGREYCRDRVAQVVLKVSATDPDVDVDPVPIRLRAHSGAKSNYGRFRLSIDGYWASPADLEAVMDDGEGKWLFVDLASCWADAARLSPGTYRGSIRFRAPNNATRVTSVPVILTVEPGEPRSNWGGPPLAASIVDARSKKRGPVSPGQRLTIHGLSLANAYAGPTRVFFDETEASVLSAAPTRLDVIVPETVAGKRLTHIRVESAGMQTVTSAAIAGAIP